MTQTPPRDPNRGNASGNAKPDPLLDRLAALARDERDTEQRDLDPRWDALAAGTLDDAEIAELRALAEASPEHARAWEAFQPLGDDFQQRILAQITPAASSHDPSEAGDSETRHDAGGDVVPWRPASEARPTSRPARRPPRRWARTAWIPLAAAAAFAAFWLRPEAVVPLPEYEGRLSGVRSERSTTPDPAPEASSARFAPGSRFELVLAPATEVVDAIDIATWLQRGDSLAALDLPHEIADSGAVRISGRVGDDIELPSGDSILVVAVFHGGHRASSRVTATTDTIAHWLETGRQPEGDTLKLLRFEITVEPQPPPPPETDD